MDHANQKRNALTKHQYEVLSNTIRVFSHHHLPHQFILQDHGKLAERYIKGSATMMCGGTKKFMTG